MRKIILAFAASLMLSTSAHAQWMTLDIANLVQSIMTVLSSYEQEAVQAEQLMNQYQQLENEYRQLKSIASGTFPACSAPSEQRMRTSRAITALCAGCMATCRMPKRSLPIFTTAWVLPVCRRTNG